MKNPFPGMNPWLQGYWRDVHAKLLVYASDAINDALPAGLRARVDERLSVESDDEDDPRPKGYVPDVAITEDWDRPTRSAAVLAPATATVEAARPVVVNLGEALLRHLEVVDSEEHVITALELLSPPNKEDGQDAVNWRRKRADYLRGASTSSRWT